MCKQKCFGEKKRKAIGLPQGEKKFESGEERGLLNLWWLRVLSAEERRREMGGPWGGGVLSLGRRVCSGCAIRFLLYHHPASHPRSTTFIFVAFHCHQVRFVLLLRWSSFIWVTCRMTSNSCL